MAKETTINIDKKMRDGVPGDRKDTTTLKAAIDNTQELIDFNKRNIVLVKKQFDIMKKFPKRCDPMFEYEKQDEWVETQVEKFDMEEQFQVKELEFKITDDEKQLETFKKLLED